MNGEYNVYTDVEYILSLALMLIGCFALAFLVGELTNTVSNLDPVTNDFRMRLDNLNDYMEKGNFPEKLRSKLREYIMESEEIFGTTTTRASSRNCPHHSKRSWPTKTLGTSSAASPSSRIRCKLPVGFA